MSTIEQTKEYTVVLVTGDDSHKTASELAKLDDRFVYWRDPYYHHPDIYRKITTNEADPVRNVLAIRLASLMQTLLTFDTNVDANKIPAKIYLMPAPCFNAEFKALPIVDQGNFARALAPIAEKYTLIYVWENEVALEPTESAVYRTQEMDLEVTRVQLLMILNIGTVGKSVLMSTIRRKALESGFKQVRQADGSMDLPESVYETFKSIAESNGIQVVDDVRPNALEKPSTSGISPWHVPSFEPDVRHAPNDNREDSNS